MQLWAHGYVPVRESNSAVSAQKDGEDMLYYSFDDVMRSHKLSREALKQRVKRGTLKAEKLVMSQANPDYFKYIIPETELSTLEEFKVSEPVASDDARPDYYVKRWQAKAERLKHCAEQRQKWEEERQRQLEEWCERHKYDGDYYSYLQSNEWKTLRAQALKRDGYRCQMCDSGTNLQAHHVSYEHLHTDEELDDVVTLCKECHEKVHAKDLERKQEQNSPNGLFDMDDDYP